MSGKNKQAHRTKGNTKPSNSGHAAQLLAASGSATSGFIGFDSFSGDLGYVPATTAGNDDVDSGIDADFRLVLRKLSKKDSTTKLKALQEFGSLCKEKDSEDVKLMLPYWPRIYSRVAIDNDRRVREAAQLAFEQLVLRVRRRLAPHLKCIMGSWLVAQCDSHAPAASAAKAAFQSAFPAAKQTEAIVFCKNEILAHVQDNLFTQTAKSLSDPKTTAPEDAEAKYQKLVASTLMALRLFIETVPASHQESLYPQYRSFLANTKLWKMGKHSSEQIQGAFYSLLASVCHCLPELASEFSSNICPVVLHNLDKTDPIVCPALWEAALNVVTNVEDCWTRVNARKGVLPKLWVLLRQGAGGSARAVYPNLLPFLSRIPAEVIGSDVAFYQEFFSNMKEGLATEKVQMSPSECSAVVQAFIECLRYVVTQHLDHQNASDDITRYLLIDQLLPLVEASLVDSSSALAASPLFSLVVDLVTYLNKTMTDSDENATRIAAQTAFSAFWDSFSSMCVNLVADSPERILQRLATLLKSFRSPIQCVNKKKSGKVRFAADDVKPSTESVPEKAAAAGIMPPPYEEIFESTSEMANDDGDAFKLVCQLCRNSFARTRGEKPVSLPHVQFLASLARTYMCDSLMSALLEEDGTANVPRTAPQFDLILAVVERLLLPWLHVCDDIADADSRTTVIDSLVEIAFAVFDVCSSVGDRVRMLTTLLQEIQSAVVLSALVRRGRDMSHDAAVHQWFHGNEFGQRMVDVTTRLCERSLRSTELCGGDMEIGAEMDACWVLMSFALSASGKSEPQISTEYIDRILVEIRTALPTPDQLNQLTADDVHRCVSFVCEITHSFFENIEDCVVMRSAEELLSALFRLSCQHCILSDNLVQRVSTTWQQGVKALVRQSGGYLGDGGFLVQAVALVDSLLQDEVDSVDKLLRLCDDVLMLARCVTTAPATDTDTRPDLSSTLVKELLRPLCTPHTGCDRLQCPTGPLITGQLTFSAPVEDKGSISSSHLPKFLTSTAFASLLLVAMQPVAKEAVSVVTECKDDEGSCKGSDAANDFSLQMDVACSIAFCRAVLLDQRQTLESSEMGRILTLLETNFCSLFEVMSPEDVKTLVQNAIDRSMEEGLLWSLALDVVLERLQGRNSGIDLLTMTGATDRFVDVTESSLHTLQVALRHLPTDDITHVAEIRAAQLLTCPPEGLLRISGGLGFLSVCRVATSLVTCDDVTSSDSLLSIETLLSLSGDAAAMHSAVCDTDWPVLSYNIELMRLMRVFVANRPMTLSPKDWDIILCRTVSMVQMCDNTIASLASDVAVATFVTEACRLVTSVATCMQTVISHLPDAFPVEILTEWTELFSASIYGVLLPLFSKVTGCETFHLSSAAEDVLTKAVCSAVALCPLPHLLKHQMALLLVADDDTNLPDELQTLMNHLCPLLVNHRTAAQFAAYRMLMSVMPSLPAFDEGKRKEDEQGEGSRSPPMALMSILDLSSHAVDHVLEDTDIGETALITPSSEEHTYAVAYLLSWKLLLVFFKSASSELRSEYAQHLQQMGAVDRLLVDLFRLLPETPEGLPRRPETIEGLPRRPADGGTLSNNMFVDEPPPLEIAGNSSGDVLAHMACAVYYHVLEDLPAIMRQWWNSQDKRVAGVVEKYTSRYVSPQLCAQEMQAVQSKDTDLTNMTVKVRPTIREVVAMYVVEEITMELVVTLPVNHPLGPISVECGRRVGVANTQWRNWMLQMITFLSHQNGSILDGLLLWKRSVDKKFEGVEDCMVCFSVIHGTNYQLPRLQCRTCKKKFHSACLYKWFSTSNKSTCPLCRNLF